MKTRTLHFLAVRVSLALILTIGIGCEGGSRARRVTVTGTASYDGKPVETGMIQFTVAEAGFTSGDNAQGVVKDGRFSVPNVSPGHNSVTVTGGPAPQNQGPFTYDQRKVRPRDLAEAKKIVEQASLNRIPPDAPGNSITVDVKEGMEPLAIKIFKK
jgi:hypothetical protein